MSDTVETGGARISAEVADILASCPPAGEGVHPWLFYAAEQLHEHVEDQTEIETLLAEACSKCGRVVPRREISDAVRNSTPEKCEQRREASEGELPWPPRNTIRIAEIAKQGPTKEALRQRSPVKFAAPRVSQAEMIADALFPGNPLLCVGKRQSDLAWPQEREEWRGELATLQYIVPSPMSATEGLNQSGKLTNRCLANTGPRRFLVIEADPPKYDDLSPAERARFGTEAQYSGVKQDEQAAILFHLGQYAPLVLAVHSGGKSIHGWFYCHGQDESKVREFMRYAVSLGADRATFTKCQWVRLPDGQRRDKRTLADGRRQIKKAFQETIYFNPEVLPR